MAGGVPDPAGPWLPAPRAGCQARRSRRPSRAPLGSERDGGGGDLALSRGSLAKRAALAQGKECAGRHPQPATPSLGGNGQRRCVPFQGSARIRVPVPSAHRCCALVTRAEPWGCWGPWWSVWAALLRAEGDAHRHRGGLQGICH